MALKKKTPWSPSTLTMPVDAWILKELGHRDGMNAPMAAGIAVEDGVKEGLIDHKRPISQCVALAFAKFDRLTALKAISEESKANRRKHIEGMVTHAINALRPYGTPEFPGDGQHKVSLQLDGCEQSHTGFLDFLYPDHGLIVDLKTTLRLPTANVSDSHRWQGAVYGTALGNHEMRFAYASGKECRIFRQEDIPQAIEEVRLATIAREKFMGLFSSYEEMAQHVVPDYSSFYMSSPAMRAAGKKVFGF
jgi:hypothetical protein